MMYPCFSRLLKSRIVLRRKHSKRSKPRLLATGTDVLLLAENTRAAIQCIKLIMVRYVLEQTVKQNLYFF